MNSVTQTKADARQRLLDTAIGLFAAKGAAEVSLRELTSLARVNVAAVNYYFGSRLGLEEAVFEQVAVAVNAQRSAALSVLLEQAEEAGRPPDVQAIALSFIDPYLTNTRQGSLLAQLILKHRIAPTDMTKRLTRMHFDPMGKRYVQALTLARPDIDATEFVWRYMFMTSVVVLTATDRGAYNRVAALSEGKLDAADTDALKAAMLRFILGGLTSQT